AVDEAAPDAVDEGVVLGLPAKRALHFFALRDVVDHGLHDALSAGELDDRDADVGEERLAVQTAGEPPAAMHPVAQRGLDVHAHGSARGGAVGLELCGEIGGSLAVELFAAAAAEQTKSGGVAVEELEALDGTKRHRRRGSFEERAKEPFR